jgi:hypothetical protein
MLNWFRIEAPRVAVLALLSLAGTGASLGAHGSECHDECRTVVVAHDADAHHLRAAGAAQDGHPLHCVVCHWVRSFRPHAAARIGTVPAVQVVSVVHVDLDAPSSAAPAAQPPLRSPPPSPAEG